MRRTICIYHGNCADGFTAAWAVWRALGDSVEFIPGVYGEAPPDVTGADVIMVDFSYKRPFIERMAAIARSILILDHHATAKEDLDGFPPPIFVSGWKPHIREAAGLAASDVAPGLPRVLFDMDRSGAQIAWDFFLPDQCVPDLVDYVADRDLWKFELPHSRAIAAWVFSHDYDFATWSKLQIDLQKHFPSVVAQGQAILRKQDKDVAELVKVTRRPMKIGGITVPVANLPHTLASDAAGAMAEGQPFAACYFDRADGQRVFSLRSRDGGVDVSRIAAAYGGGGHKAAAGFKVPLGWEGDR